MIRAESLSKQYGDRRAVDDVTFTVEPGQVTGFLGPNGAGKSTTMRMIVGLDRPSAGSVTVNGKRYAEHRAPLQEVGVLLDAKAAHTGRSAYHHLLAIAATHRIPKRRVHEVIGLAGLESVAGKRVGGFSLGMGQRLGIAAALLGDPHTLILDEPVNGLDPEGVRWVRLLIRGVAAEGRTVLLSSHLMSEMSMTADRLIVIGRGRIIADAPIDDIVQAASAPMVRLRVADDSRAALRAALASPAITVAEHPDGLIELSGLSAAEVGALAARDRIVLHELGTVTSSLEDAYLQLTEGAVEYRTGSEPSKENRS